MMEIEIDGLDLDALRKTGLKRATADSMGEAVSQYARRPDGYARHFQSGNEARYGLKPRSKGYSIRKARRTGRNQPLVFSGRTRDLFATGASVNVSGSGRVTLKFPWPSHLRPSGGKTGKNAPASIALRNQRARDVSVQLRQELSRVAPEDKALMRTVAADKMGELLGDTSSPRYYKKRRKKI